MKIGIVGLGLIGGSLGLDWRSQGMTVFGISRQLETCERAMERGICDRASPDLSLLSAVEVIAICTPLAHTAKTLQALIPYLSPQTIVTDVGSVKAPIVESCSPLWPYFIGGHPMAGTEAQGIEAGQRHLFANRPYVLTPTAATPPDAIETALNLVRSLGAIPYLCDPTAHDRAVAWISHLPVMVSASLIAACSQETDLNIRELAHKLASSGFRDTSRVGGGNPELGLMMAKYNSTALLRSLLIYRQQLDCLIAQIERQDEGAIAMFLEAAHRDLLQFGSERKGIDRP
jgi:arogenate dehydrogenase (NADP+)